MRKTLALLLVCILCMATFVGCGGSQQPTSANPPADAGASPAPEAPAGDGKAQAAEGKRITLGISNEDTEKGALSAVCPDGWYDHSNDEKLFFSESETPGDYAKPYVQISYAPTATSTGGSGEDISFEMGGMNWEGLHNGEYNTYTVTHQLKIGGGLSVISAGVGPDDAVYQLVVGSILVEF